MPCLFATAPDGWNDGKRAPGGFFKSVEEVLVFSSIISGRGWKEGKLLP